MAHYTELLLAPTIADITPEQLDRRGIRLLGVDLENVLTSAGELPVFPWAQAALERLQQSSELQLVLITGASDVSFVEQASSITGLPFIVRDKTNRFRNKMYPDMYQEAGRRFDVEPEEIGMVDDQYKNLLGARRAGLGLYVWTTAIGHIDRKGVKASAIVEKTLLRPSIGLLQWLGSSHIEQISQH